jgi:hypothetical protein
MDKPATSNNRSRPAMNKPATKETAIMSNSGILDTRFRSALARMATQGRLRAYTAQADAHLEIAAIMKKLDRAI